MKNIILHKDGVIVTHQDGGGLTNTVSVKKEDIIAEGDVPEEDIAKVVKSKKIRDMVLKNPLPIKIKNK